MGLSRARKRSLEKQVFLTERQRWREGEGTTETLLGTMHTNNAEVMKNLERYMKRYMPGTPGDFEGIWSYESEVH